MSTIDNKKSFDFSKENRAFELSIQLPASKSISNRALILNTLSYSPYEIENLSDCDDTEVMLRALESNESHFDVGAAGTSMRFLTAFLSKTVGEWSITGSERMKQRPIKILVDALNQLGAKISYLENDGYPPLKIYGSALMGGRIKLDGSVSSQYVSALMMIAPFMVNGIEIELVGEIISTPYILMTKKMMGDFGIEVNFDNNIIAIKEQNYKAIPYSVESDWSAASYWYEMLAINKKGKIKLAGLNKNSLQGDSQVASIFENLGVKTTYLADGIEIEATENWHSAKGEVFEYDFIEAPDLAQTVVVTCCANNIAFRFKGLKSLKIKETNRVLALITELKKFGFLLTEPNEGEIQWLGEKQDFSKNISIKTYDDHRMAMAFAPFALIHNITIENPEVVSKSYPNFWQEFDKIIK